MVNQSKWQKHAKADTYLVVIDDRSQTMRNRKDRAISEFTVMPIDNQKKFVNARTCKHLRATLGDDYEDARIKLREEEAELENSGLGAKPKSKRVSKRKQPDEDEDAANDDYTSQVNIVDPSDPLSSIGGVTPLNYMPDGFEKEVNSQSRSVLSILYYFHSYR